MGAPHRKKTTKRQREPGPRTPWHLLLFLLLQERAPRDFQVRSEVPLGRELPRADVVLLRRNPSAESAPAGILRGLWSMIALDAVMEFKSVAHGFRRGELGKLLAYSGLYFWLEADRLACRENLLSVVLVPSLTPTLTTELEALGFSETDQSDGYHRYGGGTFPLAVVEVDRVADAERDELLGFLGNGTLESEAARNWLYGVTGVQMDKMQELDEYQDFEAKLIALLGDKVLASMSPEQRLVGLAPEQRLAGLAPEQRLVGLAPEQVLAGLTKEQMAQLRRLLDEQN